MAIILIVDDSSNMRDELRIDLQEAGHTVLEAADGEEGFKQATENKIDLIISDLNMPNVDGLTMCSHIRQKGITAPVIMLTTQINPELKAEAARLSVKAWIVKPYKKNVLINGIAKLIT